MKYMLASPEKLRRDLLQALGTASAPRKRFLVDLDRYQLARNPILRRWRSSGGRALPIIAFRESVVSCLAPQQRNAWFESSGTSGNVVSRHYFQSPDVYRSSVVAGWKWQMQERGMKLQPSTFVGIMPSFCENPHSSLSCMVDVLMKEFGNGHGFWAMKKNRWDWNGLRSRIQRSMKHPLVLFGTAFGWVHFLDWCDGRRLRFHLPPGTLVLETGGYKGRSRELKRDELHRSLSCLLGLRRQQIISEYSMCELSSQAYSFPGRKGRTIFRFPPWCRHHIAGTGTVSAANGGTAGVLEIHDPANLDSCAWIRTGDMAVGRGNGFELAGRVPSAGLKGCSLAFEDS